MQSTVSKDLKIIDMQDKQVYITHPDGQVVEYALTMRDKDLFYLTWVRFNNTELYINEGRVNILEHGEVYHVFSDQDSDCGEPVTFDFNKVSIESCIKEFLEAEPDGDPRIEIGESSWTPVEYVKNETDFYAKIVDYAKSLNLKLELNTHPTLEVGDSKEDC